MSDFSDLLSHDAVVARMACQSKKQLFQKIADLAAHSYGLDGSLVLERLQERERLGSTGFGSGVAIPHAKLDALDAVRGLVVLLDEPIAFDAVDDAPVDVIFALLSPIDSGAEHLKTLARVSRFLRSEANQSLIRGAQSAEALYALVAGSETRDAA